MQLNDLDVPLFTGDGSKTDKGAVGKIKVREAGELGTGSERY